jgi:hypothetical protein
MADLRHCEQCGVAFTPRREHARFCSGRCRVARNRRSLGDPDLPAEPAAAATALQWSVAAMNELAQRVPRAASWDVPAARAVIGETVWQITLVDATLVRYHPDAYDGVLAARQDPERRLIEGTMGGLRFVRNRMRSADDRARFIGCPPAGPECRAASPWTWAPVAVPESAFDALLPPAREWAISRHQAYQGFLVGHRVEETFRRATGFLTLAAARSPMPAEVTGA